MSDSSNLDIFNLFAPEDDSAELQEAIRIADAAQQMGDVLGNLEDIFEPPQAKVCKFNFDQVEFEGSSFSGLPGPRIELLDDGLGGFADADPEAPTPERLEAALPTASGLSLLGDRTSTAQQQQSTQPDSLDSQYEYREIVIDANGQPRQAGADSPEGEFVRRFRLRAEQSLFVFLKGVMGRTFLTAHFHKDICEFLQRCPPFRKLVLMPREHAKTAIVSGGLPAHILIQPAATNIYFPGMEGSECRILLAGETEKMAKKNLRVVKSIFEENRTFRALWPHRCWINSRPREWSTESIIIPRKQEWPDPSIKAVGVGGAITGARPNVMIKDDLVSFKAMNSEIVMQEAIDWHVASRALLDTYEVESGLSSLEFIIGTRWAVFDLYSYIMDKDPSVEVNDSKYHRIVSDGKILWPEKHTLADIEQLRMEHGSMFYLLYLNSAADPSLTDFDLEEIRKFKIVDGKIIFEGDVRDSFLMRRMAALTGTGMAQPPQAERGQPLSLARLSEALKGGIGCRLRG